MKHAPESRRWWAHLQNLIGAAVLFGFGYYLWRHRAHFASVLDVSVLDVLVLGALVVVTWVVTSAQSWLLYRASGIRVGFWESVVLAVATAFGNYLPARVGTIARAHYLKSIHGMRYARFVSVSGIRTVLMVVATGLAGILGTVGIFVGGGPLSVELLLLFSALCIAPVLAWVWRPPARTEGAGRIRRILHDFAEGFAQLRARPGISGAVLVLVMTQYASLALRFFVAARATGGDVPTTLLLLMAPLAALVSFTAITPGGLGLREAVMGYASFATGTSFANGLYVGTLDRAVLLGMMAVFGSASFLTIWTRIRRASSASLSRAGSAEESSVPTPAEED